MSKFPLTNPDSGGMFRFSQLDGQREYVACMEKGIGFAASGPKGEWIYNWKGKTTVVRPFYENLSWDYGNIDWISNAQKRIANLK